LVVSTDPAHSLGDVLDVRLSGRPRRIGRSPRLRLEGVELNAPRALDRWMARHRSALGAAIERGTWLDDGDVEALLNLPIPGVDELIGLVEIGRLAADKYDVVIVDMAPTGHALRLLAAPRTLTTVAEVLDALQEPHRMLRQRLARVRHPDATDDLIASMAREAAGIAVTLRDRRRTAFHWITLAEPLSLAESEDGIRELTRNGLHVADVIVNRLSLSAGACRLCDRRRAAEQQVVAAIRRTIGRGRTVRLVPAQLLEPRGLAALRRLGEAAAPSAKPQHPQRSPSTLSEVVAPSAKAQHPQRSPSTLSEEFLKSRLIFVGGKGGVGKTTVAAAIALRLARQRPGSSILLLSTDPAHSIADVLDSPVGDDPNPVRGAPANLVAREMDAARALDSRRGALRAAFDEMDTSFGSGVQVSLVGGSPATAARLIELAPPGIDELFGMLSVVESLTAHQTIVVDTAPTGHALRLLQMPDIARDWLRVLMRVLLKYRPLVSAGSVGAELVNASKTIRELQSVLRDRARTRFVVVTRAAAAARAETRRLMRELQSLGVAATAIVVNARTLSPGECRRCRVVAAAERREVAALGRPRHCAIIQAPLVVPPPRGAARLDRWARSWTPWIL
jgi:arsenite-transporting ATPase